MTVNNEFLSEILLRANQKVAKDLERALTDEGVSLDYWRVLDVLRDLQGHSMKELADGIGMNPPTLTKLMDKMVSAGLTMRNVDAADNRRVLVFITDAGCELVERLQAKIERHHEVLCNVLTERQARELYSLLNKIIHS